LAHQLTIKLEPQRDGETMPLKFNMLLRDEGIDPAEVRLLRHQTREADGRTPYMLWRDNLPGFESYQSTQSTKRRANFASPYWASFVASPDGRTLFVGLFTARLVGTVPVGQIDAFHGRPIGSDGNWTHYDQYDCVRVPELAEYSGRLSIHWGDSASSYRAWVQRAHQQDKPIVELVRTFREEEFPGFSRLIRPLSEIETMPATWREALRATRGIYLLACPRSREHYVGSATGADGFLGRWREYGATGHGGNVALKGRDPSDWIVSVLEVAGSVASEAEILEMETTWKLKLHSRSIGLNRN
jgi:hypothetical protein